MNAIRSFRSSKAFTLIELLIVITIIGILAVALLPRITAGPGKARDAQRKADLQQIATALALYADDSGGSYPSTGTNKCVSDIKSSISTYMSASTVPSDPKSSNKSGGCTSGYSYYVTKDGFILSAGLETLTTFGTSIYSVTTISSASIASTDTSSTALAKFTACSSAACTTSDPAYVVVR